MTIETDRLATIANFARLKGVSVTAVYHWIAQNKERSIKIDGVSFILMEMEDVRRYKDSSPNAKFM